MSTARLMRGTLLSVLDNYEEHTYMFIHIWEHIWEKVPIGD